jgi:hypothetical protein
LRIIVVIRIGRKRNQLMREEERKKFNEERMKEKCRKEGRIRRKKTRK